MAQKTQVILVDDVDGSEANQTVTFALDGVSYEIDLNDEHAAALRESLEEWIGKARRTGGRRSSCLLYTSPSPRDRTRSRMPSSA